MQYIWIWRHEVVETPCSLIANLYIKTNEHGQKERGKKKKKNEVKILRVCRHLNFLFGYNVMVFIYRIFYMRIQMQFTLLKCKGEIGHQLMSISHLIQPMKSWNNLW